VTGLALADRLAAGVLGAPSTDLGPIADALDAYLAGHEAALATLRATFSPEDRLAIVGRGASLASARTGALVAQEAAKVPALGMSAAAFRHGPLELADARLALLVLAGDEPGRELNARLADDAQRLGARAFWVDDRPRAELGFVEAPGGTGLQRVIGEIAPLQLLSVALGDRQGLEPGRFRHLDKVTASE
jgi:glucosamine--fructose-6-phosphate aminotransferase (isomerizing)